MTRTTQLGRAVRFGVGAKLITGVFALSILVASSMLLQAGATLARGFEQFGAAPDAIDSELQHLYGSLALVAGLEIAVGLLAYYFILRRAVLAPVAGLTRLLEELARTGNSKFDAGIPTSRDEIGQLSIRLSAIVEPLHAIPTSIRESTRQLAESVASLGASAHEQTETLTRQAAALHETQVTAEEIRQTSALAAQKAQIVLQYAERADSLSRTGEGAVGQSLFALRDIRVQVDEIAKRITSLGERAIRIGQVTQTVKDLADQSNMLALNAAIEAVRSGEHGKGFGVVAREIRTLADQSIQATVQVREMLDDISEAIRGAVAITEKGSQRIDAGLEQVKTSGEKLAELSNIVKDNSQAVRQINSAVGQQNEAVSQILSALTSQGSLMQDTMARLNATDSAVKTIENVSQSLVRIVTDFSR